MYSPQTRWKGYSFFSITVHEILALAKLKCASKASQPSTDNYNPFQEFFPVLRKYKEKTNAPLKNLTHGTNLAQ